MKMVASGRYAIRNTRKRLRRGHATRYFHSRPYALLWLQSTQPTECVRPKEMLCPMSTRTTQRILLVDDDHEIVRVLRAYLEQANFQVLTAYDGATAIHTIRHDRPDLVVLDLMLPDQDGWEITRHLRADAQWAALPIIMLTARIEDTDKIIGLELGADDYITKPFNAREVVARIRTVLRRTQSTATSAPARLLQIGELTLDLHRHELRIQEEAIDLTQTEFKLLQILMDNPGYAFTRIDLIEQALGYSYEGMERTLDSHIKNLRKKIEPDPKNPTYLQTVYGVGYRFERIPPA
jgi:DNA-binding response OmpR family regulator